MPCTMHRSAEGRDKSVCRVGSYAGNNIWRYLDKISKRLLGEQYLTIFRPVSRTAYSGSGRLFGIFGATWRRGSLLLLLPHLPPIYVRKLNHRKNQIFQLMSLLTKWPWFQAQVPAVRWQWFCHSDHLFTFHKWPTMCLYAFFYVLPIEVYPALFSLLE